ncbi:MAG: S-methyl-5-thioribose-1-phosphate isomerase [Intrasporangium sp.]|uniref:S-methyl-5-thioribose-1-phosphate isomerase n=1 Tax=Intrasporangium sp. TaxID=1925024 RepID=UPI003F80A692
MRTLDWSDGTVVAIDQTRLPHEEVLLRIHDVDELVAHIRSLAIRGAMALGVAGALGVALAAVRAKESGADLDATLEDAAVKVATARPTAVNLGAGVETVMRVRRQGGSVDDLVAAALAVRDADIEANRAIGRAGAELLDGATRVLTHCNAGALAGVETGTALAVIEALHATSALDMVYVCETRPLLQGSRLTAWELQRAGIPHRVVVDSAAAGLMLRGEVDAVVVGADRIAANGDVANKVGTLGHALAARRAGIPFVVAAPEMTIDGSTATGADIPIELRDESEVLEHGGQRVAAPGSRALNPAFDVTPVDLVSAIVTERRSLTELISTPPGNAVLEAAPAITSRSES